MTNIDEFIGTYVRSKCHIYVPKMWRISGTVCKMRKTTNEDIIFSSLSSRTLAEEGVVGLPNLVIIIPEIFLSEKNLQLFLREKKSKSVKLPSSDESYYS
jgi:hypothetical protein